jgi:pyridinium-3,5-bisthiocarboxylic acid mononucleotide nickel chelatase
MKSHESKTEPPAKILFVEPFSGISGDMFLGAMLDLGLDFAAIERKLRLLPLQGYHLSVQPCSRAGIRAQKFDVHLEETHGHPHEHHVGETHGHGHVHQAEGLHSHEHEHHHHRSFRDIRTMIQTSGLSDWVKQKSIEAFSMLAEAEGKIHGRPAEDVQFHEVGAVDSIIDMVGAAIAIEEIMPVRVISTEVNVGQGVLECRHGRYPAPGPATLELLKGIPIYGHAGSGEMTTPTGAAILATFAGSFGARPGMRLERVGYGAGARDFPKAANVLRLSLGTSAAPAAVSIHEQGDRVAVIEATVDDMSPQIYGYFLERALATGALDVFAVPAQMKKNRPGIMLSVVCDPSRLDDLTALVFEETTTIGVRYSFAERATLTREMLEVETAYGPVSIKVSFHGGRRANFAPEYECCRRLAQEKGAALKDVMAAAVHAYLGLQR